MRDDILTQRVARTEARADGHDQKFAALTEIMAEAASEAGVTVDSLGIQSTSLDDVAAFVAATSAGT